MTADAGVGPLLSVALQTLRDGDPAGCIALLRSGSQECLTPAHQAVLGMAWLAAGESHAARDALAAAVASGDGSRETLLNLALARARAGEVSAARTMLRALAESEPAWAEPPLRLAELAREEGAGRSAFAWYECALEREPVRPEALLGAGSLLILEGDLLRAEPLLLRCAAAAPHLWQAWDALGTALLAAGDKGAEAAFFRARRLAPDNPGVALRAAAASHAADNAEAELARLEMACAADPLDGASYAGRGALLALLGRYADAADAFEVATTLVTQDVALARAFADALVRAGRHADAVAALLRAAELDPSDAGLRSNYAAALARVHRYREARDELEALRATRGDTTQILCNLAGALVCLGEQEAGTAAARDATRVAPSSFAAWRALANASAYAAGTEGTALSGLMRSAASRAPRGALTPWTAALAGTPDPDRTLRVGLLSNALRTHPVGWLTLAGFEALDPSLFELVCIAQAPCGDVMQRRFQAAAREWHVAADHERPGDIAAQARALALDIAIDLGGYGDQGLIAAFAERIAPVKAKWVGMQNHTTGMAEMDWLITDRWETPPSLASLYSERLLTLPDGYVCYTPPLHAPPVAPMPAARRGYVTFGCFNNFAKVTPQWLALWCDILHAVARARLVLKAHLFSDKATAETVRARFAAHGIDPARIECRGVSPHQALLAQYGDVDIVLDPHPYSGGLTTCEALWMGVPVVTMPGQTFCSRHSASHLSNVGLADWIASTPDDYRDLAVTRANDLDGLASLRAGLRSRVRTSPLCDAPRFGHGLGAALRGVWREWCSGQHRAGIRLVRHSN